MCSVAKVAKPFVLVTDTYKQLTRHINFIKSEKSTKRVSLGMSKVSHASSVQSLSRIMRLKDVEF